MYKKFNNYINNNKLDKNWFIKISAIVIVIGLVIFTLCKYLEPEYELEDTENFDNQ